METRKDELFCLDNSCFMGLNEDGSMNPISKCVEGDDGYHVKGHSLSHLTGPSTKPLNRKKESLRCAATTLFS
jgi:hypothetical protein